jgi:hypothetical protein
MVAARTAVELWGLGFFTKIERVKGKNRVRNKKRRALK